MSWTLNTYMQLTEFMVVVLTATSSLHVKIDVCPGNDLQTFYLKQTVRTGWTIQTHSDELNN